MTDEIGRMSELRPDVVHRTFPDRERRPQEREAFLKALEEEDEQHEKRREAAPKPKPPAKRHPGPTDAADVPPPGPAEPPAQLDFKV
jgi:hypothetical protein